MRANEFIIEAEVEPYKYNVFKTVDDAAAIFRQNCDPAILHHPLWRGMTNHTNVLLAINPGSGIRKSENTSNHYTVLMDTSPYLTKYPKRSNSLICTTNLKAASNYADNLPYALFTFKGTPVGVCPYDDIWETPFNINAEFDSLNISKFLHISALFTYLQLPADIDAMKEAIGFPYWQERYMRMFYKKVKPEDLIDYFYKKLSPEQTGFALTTQSGLIPQMSENHECWFSGKCLAIHSSQLATFTESVLTHES